MEKFFDGLLFILLIPFQIWEMIKQPEYWGVTVGILFWSILGSLAIWLVKRCFKSDWRPTNE
jgi:hypothetical protein